MNELKSPFQDEYGNYEVCNIANEAPVICDFCNKTVAPYKAESTGGNWKTGVISGWSCVDCDNESERNYQNSNSSVDHQESMLAEMEY